MSYTPVANNCLDNQSNPSCKPEPLRASQPWICQLRPQHNLYKENFSVKKSTVSQPSTSFKRINSISPLLVWYHSSLQLSLLITCLFAKISKAASFNSFSFINFISSSCDSSSLFLSLESTTNIIA